MEVDVHIRLLGLRFLQLHVELVGLMCESFVGVLPGMDTAQANTPVSTTPSAIQRERTHKEPICFFAAKTSKS